MPFSVEAPSLSMAGDGVWQSGFSIPPAIVPSSYLVLPVWQEVFSARLQSAQRWMNPDNFVDQFLTLVYANGFTFLVPLPQSFLCTLMQLPEYLVLTYLGVAPESVGAPMDVSMLLLCILAPASCDPAFPYTVTLWFCFQYTYASFCLHLPPFTQFHFFTHEKYSIYLAIVIGFPKRAEMNWPFFKEICYSLS